MVFSSLIFIFGFLPVFLTVYYFAPPRWRNAVALVFSFLFYAWGAPQFVFVLLGLSSLDFWVGQKIAGASDKTAARRWLMASIGWNLGILAYAKYANFFADQLNTILIHTGSASVHWTAIVLPIGISFFTFHKISYLVDIYRGTTTPARTWIDFCLYIALFPQLIAGPIVRYHDIADQLRQRTYRSETFVYGLYRFCLGLGKKVLIADQVGIMADLLFQAPPQTLPWSFAWLGAIAYTFQIYFDFLGYSDMAIGLASMMGFSFLENFRQPYRAHSFTEFWQCWHISLSNWMKEYLYIPLGGNRVRTRRRYLNLWIVFLLSGLWHGANWTFIIWGAYHGFFLMLDKLGWQRLIERWPRPVAQLVTFILIVIGWVFFRSPTVADAFTYLRQMVTVNPSVSTLLLSDVMSHRAVFTMITAAIISFLPGWSCGMRIWDRWRIKATAWQRLVAGIGVSAFLFVLSVLSLTNSSFHPFIYFKF